MSVNTKDWLIAKNHKHWPKNAVLNYVDIRFKM